MNVVVVGSGGWGTALSKLLYENGHKITLCSYSAEESAQLKETNRNPFLPGVLLPSDFEYTCHPSCVKGKDLVVVAPPSYAIRNTARQIAPWLTEKEIIVSVTKGIEENSGKRMSEVICEETGKSVVVLSGPSHAEEVSRKIPTGVVAAGTDCTSVRFVQDVFMSPVFRVYTSDDPVGVELGAAMKNVIALCAGICDGIGFGDNTKALLMTRGLTEVARLGIKMGSREDTFAGLSGVGDLIVTCTSMHSRNRRAGILIGEGKSPQQAMKEIGAVVEGYYAAKSVWELAQRFNVSMPITSAAYRVLYENMDPETAVQELMTRKKSHETEDSGWNR